MGRFAGRIADRLKQRNTQAGLAVGLMLVAAVGVATKDQWDWFLADDEVQTAGVTAPTLSDVDEDTEQLYRIDPTGGSSLTYNVEERLAGTEKTASGTTTGIAGDIAVNTAEPDMSRVGKIVMNVEMFTSDSSLRDKRIRHDFLQSTHFPMAEFDVTEITGLPAEIDGEASSDIEITGDLLIKETTAPVTFAGTATLSSDQLTAEMSGTVLMSTYDIGPIHVAGLAHTEDEVRFDLTLVADRIDVDADAPSEHLLALAANTVDYPEGEFAQTVQPIIENSCAACHNEGGPGWQTFPLDTVGDAAEVASGIGLVTESRFMPPWPASDEGPEYHGDYSLTDEEIATIRTWVEEGGGIDVDPETPLKAPGPITAPIERDQVLPQRGAYVGDLDVKDDYRCMIHDVEDPEGDGEWVAGIQFEPDQKEIVHHSILYKIPAEGREEVEALDGSDGRPGWECFGTASLSSAAPVSIGGWVPGQLPRVYPEGTGLFLKPGELIVNQVHYHFDHENPADQSTLILDTLTTEEVAARDTPMTAIAGRSYLTPAEGPCTPEEEGLLCDRAEALLNVDKKYGGIARFIPDGLIDRCGGTVDDYDDLDGTKFSSTCDLNAADHGTLFSVLGHMHEFGDSYRMTLNPDTPEERVLLDIPSWSFDWQLNYEPIEAIRIKPGDKIRFECRWDRTNNTMDEPYYIIWNEGTGDEMCFSSVSVIPDLNVEGEPNAYAPKG